MQMTEPGWRRSSKPGLRDDLVHLLIGRHHDDHHLGVIADLRRREARCRAVLDRPTHGVHVHVVAGDVEALAQQVPRHLQAHGAEADHPGAFYLVRFHFRSRLGLLVTGCRALRHPVFDGPGDRIGPLIVWRIVDCPASRAMTTGSWSASPPAVAPSRPRRPATTFPAAPGRRRSRARPPPRETAPSRTSASTRSGSRASGSPWPPPPGVSSRKMSPASQRIVGVAGRQALGLLGVRD